MSANPTNEHREQAAEKEPPERVWITWDDAYPWETPETGGDEYVRAASLSSRDAEIRELLSGFIHAGVEFDDERLSYVVMQIDRRDLEKAREMYAKLQPDQINGASSTPKG